MNTTEFKGPYGDAVNYASLPDYMQGGMRRYIENGIIPGAFLQAVLTNNLYAACRYADVININLLPLYVVFLHSEAPSDCFGSELIMEAWSKARIEQGRSK